MGEESGPSEHPEDDPERRSAEASEPEASDSNVDSDSADEGRGDEEGADSADELTDDVTDDADPPGESERRDDGSVDDTTDTETEDGDPEAHRRSEEREEGSEGTEREEVDRGEDKKTDPEDAEDDSPKDEEEDGLFYRPEGVETDDSEDEETDDPDEEEDDSEDESDPTADGGTATERDIGTGTSTTVEDDSFLEAPEEDEEMPLADHIEEMMRRLGIVFIFGGVAMLVAYPTSPEIINYLWATHIPDPQFNRPRLYAPLEFILTRLKVAGLIGLIVGLPVFVYQSYKFMRPGLYLQERRYYLASVPTSLILGIMGLLFAHFLVLPFIFSYFTFYTQDAAVVAFGLRETLNIVIALMAYMAVIFQIPLFIMLAIMMGLVTREWLEEKRLIFWAVFAGLAFTFTAVDPTGMAPIIIAITMIILFEGTLAVLRWTGN